MIADIHLPMFGDHNVSNAVAAIAVALELGVAPETIQSGFEAFGGVRRRFTDRRVAGVSVTDDYGHHPVEIAAVLRAARQRVESTGGKVTPSTSPTAFPASVHCSKTPAPASTRPIAC